MSRIFEQPLKKGETVLRIFALADLHLSLSGEKPMDIFGDAWAHHTERIFEHWTREVTELDWVLIPGDISWAMKLAEAQVDLEFIGSLPGNKVLIRGNHDYWWNGISKIRNLLPSGMYALQNDSVLIGDIAICGVRGWVFPGSHEFTEHDQIIYEREVARLEMALQHAQKQSKRIWVMIHYPPTGQQFQRTGFVELLEQYQVEVCVYGHLHADGHRHAIEGDWNGVNYHLVAGDYLGFLPKRLI